MIARAALALMLAVRLAGAQAPEGADRLPLGAVADSLKVLQSLERVVLKNQKDANAWHHRGMVAWVLYERSRHQPAAKGLDWTLLIPLADTSLRRAVDIQPDNKEYFTSLARFLLSSSVNYRLYGPYGVFNDQLERARASNDAAQHMQAALNAGRVSWLRYDYLTCRNQNSIVEGYPLVRYIPRKDDPNPLSHLKNATQDYFGEVDYLKAELLFREAYDAMPEDVGAFRQYAMLLADQRRWLPLGGLAQDRIRRLPKDGWGWMVLGLASFRSGDVKASMAAFEKGLKYLDTADSKRLDRIERILGKRDLEEYTKIQSTLDDSARKETDKTFWRMVDPLWSVPGTEPRLEFLARMTYAELRWTSEDRTLNGVNSDWGVWYIRRGQLPPLWDVTDPAHRSEVSNMCKPKRAAWYVMNDTTVVKGPASQWYAYSRVRVDSIPVQMARFRAGPDSTDVLIATRPPVENILRSSSVKTTVRGDFWLQASGIRDVIRDSLPDVKGVVKFTPRVAAGGYTYRFEASADGASSAGRATARFNADNDERTGYTLSGFGMSDVLVATQVQARADARSWREVNADLLVGPAPRKSTIALVWENYDLGSRDGTADYDIAISIRREDNQSRAGKIAASVIGAFASVAGVQRSDDGVDITVKRATAFAPVIVDNVSLALGDTPVGTYVLTVKITDRVSGRTTARSQQLVIRDPPPTPTRR